jgi:phenylalanyl-tRNA synthetase beta chain
MKLTYGWIREFVDLDLSAAEAADRLVNGGIEVASVTPLAPELRGVVVGEIEAIERELGPGKHGYPLYLCRVTTGRERFAVVCGAPNTRAGLRTAFAPPGAVLPGGRPIGVAKLHGVESQGMLCSERELGIGDEHDAGILALDPDAPLGGDLVACLRLDDHVLEIEITPNRVDCLSVVGIARELGALTGARFTAPAITLKESDEPVETLVRVRVEDPDLCHRFTARVIDGVRIAASPAWLAQRLRAVGLRPISNVVDITNYVMWEIGHPLHAFDYHAVTDATIVVRRARRDERMTTLDGQARALDPSMLLITDPRHAIGIAGVMGGANTEVSESTGRVLLESAYFAPTSIRRTSRTLGLKSDAAYRFERGADIEALADGSARAAQMMTELAGGTLARGMVDVYPTPHARPTVRFRMSRIQRVIGAAPPRADARRILVGLGLGVRDRGEDLEVEIPSFRRDLAIEDDLVEEVARVWGFDRIPTTLEPTAARLVRQPPGVRQAETARAALIAAGLHEAVTSSFTDSLRELALRSGDATEPLALLNPLAQDAPLLRQHPLAGLLTAVATNLRQRQPSVRLFEVGKTYARHDGGTREPRWVAIAVAGLRHDPAWYAGDASADVYDAKGLAEHVLDALGVSGQPAAGRLGGFETDAHGALASEDGTVVAEFGEIAGAVRERFDLPVPVFAAVVALDALPAVGAGARRYQALPRFPAVQRDLAFVIDDPALDSAVIAGALRTEAGPLLRGLGIFDVFRLPDGRRSVAWRLTFQADDRTLTDDEVNALRERIVRALTGRYPITLRGQA